VIVQPPYQDANVELESLYTFPAPHALGHFVPTC